jgi:lactate dehydrogenase-like 2-hydroxyacid dehydrogenase
MGRIGQAIAHRCHYGFGCRIVYVNRSAEGGGHAGRAIADADGAAGADVVVLATPGGAETHHLMGADEFAR